jgi:hypothetical protein
VAIERLDARQARAAGDSGATENLREKLGEYFLTQREGAAHLAFDEQCIGDPAHRSESNFVLNPITHQCAAHAIARFRQKLMAVMPSLEWTFVLHVGEVMVPFEFGDACDPLGAHRKERERAKGSHDDRADSGGLGESSGIWRRNQSKFVNSSIGCCGHDARQVFGIREERENMRDREGNPVGELEIARQADLAYMSFVVLASLRSADSRGGCLHMSPEGFSTVKAARGAECKKNVSE